MDPSRSLTDFPAAPQTTSDQSSGGQADFRLLPAPTREALVAIGVPRTWRAGQTVLRVGDVAEGAFLIRRGRIRLRILSPDGSELILGWFHAGMLGQLVSAVAEVASPCDLVAVGRCELLHLDRRRLTELIGEQPAVGLAIARLLSVRLGLVLDMLRLQSLESLADRVWATLLRLAHWSPPTAAGPRARRVGTLAITQGDLAHAVGGSRYRVGLALAALADAGHIEKHRGRLTIFAAA